MQNEPFRIRTAQRDEFDAALTLLFDERGVSADLLAVRVEHFKEFLGLDSLSQPAPVVVQAGGSLVAAAMIIAYPGGTATLLLPNRPAIAYGEELWNELLRDLIARASRLELTMVQVLLEPEFADFWGPIFSAAGLQHLADLDYLESQDLGIAAMHPPLPLHWRTYTAELHRTLAETVERTYQGSLDCPLLNGIREIEDVLAGHKAAGLYRPQLWQLLFERDQPAGCLILSGVYGRDALEVVYMGLVPEFRARGWGKFLLSKASELARRENCSALTLAVDTKNHTAQELYLRYGFHRVLKRVAYVYIFTPR